MQSIPKVTSDGGRYTLFVDGQPFLALGAQWDFRNAVVPARSEYLYAHAAAMNCTTAFVPVLWSQIEPECGGFTFDFVQRQLALAAQYGLRLSLLWFGSNRGGGMRFKNRHYPAEDRLAYTYQVPAHVVDDPATYRRACTPDGRPQESLCPTCRATLAAEEKAFRALLRYLAAADPVRTVVLMQVENEISTPESDRLAFAPRCYCPACNGAYARSGWTERRFGDVTYGDYVTALIEAGAGEYALPFYVNFVGTPRPGEDIAYYLEKAPHLISCAPDIYAGDAEGFRRNLAAFAVGRNVPLVAETSSDVKDPTELNVYQAVIDGGAVGFDLWAIDCAYGLGAWEDGYAHRTPLVDRRGGWSDKAYAVRTEFGVLRRTMGPLCLHRGTERLQWFTSDGEACGGTLHLPRLHGRVGCEAGGRGLAILMGDGDLTLAGHGLTLRLDGAAPEITALAGGWAGSHFVPDGGPVPIDEGEGGIRVALTEPKVVRLTWRT